MAGTGSTHMSRCCAVDLHLNNGVVALSKDADRVVYQRRWLKKSLAVAGLREQIHAARHYHPSSAYGTSWQYDAASCAIVSTGACALTAGTSGITDASTTRKPSTPHTRKCESTTLVAGSRPAAQVPA